MGHFMNIPLHFSLVPQETSAPSYAKLGGFSPRMLKATAWPDCVEMILSMVLYTLRNARTPTSLCGGIDINIPILQMGN